MGAVHKLWRGEAGQDIDQIVGGGVAVGLGSPVMIEVIVVFGISVSGDGPFDPADISLIRRRIVAGAIAKTRILGGIGKPSPDQHLSSRPDGAGEAAWRWGATGRQGRPGS